MHVRPVSVEPLLRQSPLFSSLAPAELTEMLPLFRGVELRPDEVLCQEGNPGTGLWLLGESARVNVRTRNTHGDVSLASVGPGETVGEMSLIDEGARSGTARVESAGQAVYLDAKTFAKLRTTLRPAAYRILRELCRELCSRLRATNDKIVPPGHASMDPSPQRPLPRCDGTELQRFGPFASLPAVVRLALSQKLCVLKTRGVEPIFGEGEPADAAYFLVEGDVTIGRNGRTLANLGPGGMIGLVACIDGGRRSASVVTTGPSLLLRLSKADFDALFAASNRFAFELVERVARQLVTYLRVTNQLVNERHAPPALPELSLEDVLLPEPATESLPLDYDMQIAVEDDEPL